MGNYLVVIFYRGSSIKMRGLLVINLNGVQGIGIGMEERQILENLYGLVLEFREIGWERDDWRFNVFIDLLTMLKEENSRHKDLCNELIEHCLSHLRGGQVGSSDREDGWANQPDKAPCKVLYTLESSRGILAELIKEREEECKSK